jgi:hypothetical protein
LFIIGCVLYVRRYKLGMMITWLGGTVLYLIVLFNSNGQHNYYQIPFVAPLSVMSALCVAEMTKRGRVWSIAAMCLVVTLVVGSVRYCNETFFVRDLVREMAAAAIARNTTRADVIATGMMDSGPGDPRLLYRADRLGFSANSQVMSPDVIEGFRKNGATVLAMVTREREVLSNEIRSMGYPFNSVPLVQGRVRVGLVHLARLEDPSTGRARGPGGPAAEPR